ncbi:MAG: hydroxymethylglutaryl-CoA reductase, degradative [Kofleriaceae bacterium]|nr:hydroxymethylglutaryl-CoA reductase, degradative [Kofleriaceae bacterium]
MPAARPALRPARRGHRPPRGLTSSVMSSRLPGLYRLPIAERRRQVGEACGLDPAAWADLDAGGLDLETADGMIENVVGTSALPFAVATNFTIDGVDRLVPMAVEEPSIVAAASNAARMARAGGGFTTESSPPVMIGQIQVIDVADVDAGAAALTAARAALLDEARALVPRLVERGGGPVDVEVRILARPPGPDGGVVVVHLHVDCRDAMGANLVNTLCEGMATRVASLAGGAVGLRILSNLTDRRTVRVTTRVPLAALGDGAVDPADVAEGIAAASRFAEVDPYRAATHNKGIMNGIDAVLVATAQDWRAVEAGAHAFAAHDGPYRPLATWRITDAGDALAGELALPLAVGVVGGALHVHRAARLALRLAGVEGASDLAAVAAAAGLATNLAALRALATEGIQRGHMALHARVVARAAGASGALLDRAAAEIFASGDVKPERAREIVDRLRREDVRSPGATP